IVAGPLLEELRRGLGVAAEEAAAGGCERYTQLLEAALTPAIRDRADRVPVPLVDPIDGRTTMDLDALRRARSPIARQLVLVAEQSSPLTWALAGAGRPVIRHLALGPILRRITGEDSVMAAEHACAFAAATEARDEDAALSAELARLLRAAGREIQAVRLAVFSGVGHGEMSRVVRAVDAELARAAVTALSLIDDARKRPWGRSSTLFVNADHDTVRLARRRARSDVPLAAQLLCRALLLTEGPLDKRVVDGLLGAAVSRASDV
ncbi:MAG TPA: hypothetical protein VLT33_37340, partial [Labilithrix sp.]|nr:hypothetical protein [Labilithrix sp.]